MQQSNSRKGISNKMDVPKLGIGQESKVDDFPICAMCMERLGTYGGPASLVCGHNGCLECLQKVQFHSADPVCPLCRTPFEADSILGLNLELKDALERLEIISKGALTHKGEELNHYVLVDSWEKQASPGNMPDKGCQTQSSEKAESTYASTVRDNRNALTNAPPDVNLWNVLNGMVAIVTGRNRSQTDQEHQRQVFEEEAAEDSGNMWGTVEDSGNMWGTVHSPTAPSFLIGPGEEVQAIRSVMEAEPPQWIPDSASKTCMQCDANFMPFSRGRHHCRFCGGIFCRWCSRGRCLLPPRFLQRDPQRVCDTCYERLEPVQRILIDHVSNASQIAIHDVTDLTCMKGWLNSPLGLSMEQEIYKATNTLRSFCKIGRLNPERFIPHAILRGANGLAIFTVIKAGIVLTYKFGTGLVVARRGDGTWSAPSAIMSCGLGWGAQVGGELTDFIIVLRTFKAVKAFSGHAHISVGAGLSAAAGPLGRVAEADLRVGDTGGTACYTYCCSQGAFIGISLESNLVAVRNVTNSRFYGDPYLTASDILFGTVPRPKAAAPLYSALYDLLSEQILTPSMKY